MTVAGWLTARIPEPPPRLGTRLREVLAARLAADTGSVPTACLDSACELLESLVARPEAKREAALDLLTVDALVTYAFEALADDPQALSGLARDSMQRLAALAPQPR